VPAGEARSRVGDARPSTADLRSFLEEKLPVWMVPSSYVFLSALPLTANGKVDRLSLPAPARERPDPGRATDLPRNALERVLVEACAEVLGVDEVGINDNFFTLGGASIQGLRMIMKANAAGLDLTPMMLFEHQTVAELAAVADSPAARSLRGEPRSAGKPGSD
jgi:fengycin family lipopeptide synthetase B